MNRLACAFAVLACISCSRSGETDRFSAAEFKNPGAEYRSLSFWSLNDRLEAKEMERQLEGFKKAGFGGVFLHSRTGLLTPYLSEEWFDLMAAGVKKCGELGLEAWFYDEDKWPSGFAGGIVPSADDSYRARALVCLKEGSPMEEGDEILHSENGLIFVSRVDRWGQSWYNGTCWVDLMNPDMVRCFIDCTYRPYAERFGGIPHVKGIFTDEPQIRPPRRQHEGAVAEQISFSPRMEEAFSQLWGYELRPVLPALFSETGEWRKVRLHYYRTAAWCMEQAFSRQLGEYCAENGIAFTGHYNGEQTPSGNMENEGNLSQQLRHMQRPGCDALGLYYQVNHNDNIVTSVANQYGQRRRICEIFGISGHNMSFEDRMWIAAWHCAMGINCLCPHLSLYSMKGVRKTDYPPAFSYQQPYWKYNSLFEDFAARLCYVSSLGKMAGEACVISSLESDYLGPNPADDVLEGVLDHLVKMHVACDVGDEQIIADAGSVRDGRFVIGEMAYSFVVLPKLVTIRPSTLALLLEFAAKGGKILAWGALPVYVEGEENAPALEALASYATLVDGESFAEAVEKSFDREFTLAGDGDKIISSLRHISDGALLQLSNSSRRECAEVNLGMEGPLALLNPLNGEFLKLERSDDGTCRLHFAEAQTWIVLSGKAASRIEFDGCYAIPGEDKVLKALDGPWKIRRQDLNALPIDFASYSFDGGGHWSAPEPFLALRTRWSTQEPFTRPLLLKSSFTVKDLPSRCLLGVEQPGMYKSVEINGHALSFNGEDWYIDRCIGTSDATPYIKEGLNEVVLSLDFTSAQPASADPVARYGSEIETFYLFGDFGVSGTPAAEQPVETWRERFRPLAPKPMPTRFVHGSFALVNEDVETSGDLVLNGYPFYAGSMVLEKNFELTEEDCRGALRLKLPCCETIIADVEVNGKALPTLFCNPWEVSLEGLVKPGANHLRIALTNSLRNLMGPYHHAGAEFAKVGPAHFSGADEWPNFEKGDNDWYDKRLEGKTRLWRDDYYSIAFGMIEEPVLIK